MKYVGNVQSQANSEVYATASGALPNGTPVVVNSDGSVSVIAPTEDSFTNTSFGTTDNFLATVTVFDSNSDRIVIAFIDFSDSNKGKAVVGNVNANNSVTFGTAVVFNTASIGTTGEAIAATFDSNSNKVVIAYKDTGNNTYGTALVGTVDPSDNSISFGSKVVYYSGTVNQVGATFDSSSNKVVIGYRGLNDDGFGIVGTVSGSSISFGGATEFSANKNVAYIAPVFDSNSNKVAMVYQDNESAQGLVAVGTVSGTSISFVTSVVFTTNETSYIAAVFDTNSNKVVIVYRDGVNNDYGTAIVGTVSGTSISYGTAVVFRSANSAQMNHRSVFNPDTNTVIISYLQANHGEVIIGTVSGTSISFGDFSDNGPWYNGSAAYDSVGDVVVMAGRFPNESEKSKVTVFSPAGSNLTSENFVGITNGVVEYDVVPASVGSAVVFNTDATKLVRTLYDTNSNRIVHIFQDGANDVGRAIVGTVSGTSISYGSEVGFADGTIEAFGAAFDSSANKIIIAYATGSKGRAVVGTVSGTGISFGTVAEFDSANPSDVSVAYDAANNKSVIFYRDTNNSNYLTSIVSTVSGTNISFGTGVVANSANSRRMEAVYDPDSEKIVVPFAQVSDNTLKAIVGTVSGTGISFGSLAAINSLTYEVLSSTYDSANDKVIVAGKQDNNTQLDVFVGTVSGTSISFGTVVTPDTDRPDTIGMAFDTSASKVILAYGDEGNSTKGTAIAGTVSGTSITFESAFVFEEGNTGDIYGLIAYDPDQNKTIIGYADGGDSDKGKAVVYTTPVDNTVRGSTASGATAIIQAGGAVNTLQTGLTPGQQYFLQTDGTLGLTAGSPSVIAGTAVSATDLIVKG